MTTETSSRQHLTARVARWSATHPWRAIAAWITFIAICIVAGGMAGTKSPTDHQLGTGESGRASDIVASAGMHDPNVENVLITARAGTLDQSAAKAIAAEVAARMKPLTEVQSVGDVTVSPNGQAVLLPVTMRGDPDKAGDHVKPLLAVTKSVQAAHENVRVEQTGGGSIDQGIGDELSNSFAKATKLSLPITVLILLVAFGAIVAAGVPVILALSAVGGAIGLTALASQIVPAADTINEVVLLMGMAVGVDYSLFYLKREREEMAKLNGLYALPPNATKKERKAARKATKLQAIEVAAATSGRAVLVSGCAVIVSMAGLYLAADVTFASLATGSIIVVAVAMLGSLTVLPALLAKLGRAVDRPRVPLLWRLSNRPEREPRLWPALLRPALNHPGRTLTIALAGLILLAQPAFGMKLHNSTADDLPTSIPSVQAYHRLTAAFPSEASTLFVAVRSTPQDAAEVTTALTTLGRDVQADPLFSTEAPHPVISSPDGTVHRIDVDVPHAENSKAAQQSLEKLRRQLVPNALKGMSSSQYAVGGDIAENHDFDQHAAQKLPWVMAFVLLLTFVMMAFTFRSIVVALTAISVNLLSAGAAFGLMVLVFQRSWAEGLLDFHSSGAIVAWLPIFLFVVLFGLSMDYHVFVVSRIQEGVKRGLSTRDAVREGITRTAGVVTSAAVVMVSVFAVFATLSMIEFKQLGIGLSAAVLIDALVIRIVVLPSAMTLMGRFNWWPGELSRKNRRAEFQPAAERELAGAAR